MAIMLPLVLGGICAAIGTLLFFVHIKKTGDFIAQHRRAPSPEEMRPLVRFDAMTFGVTLFGITLAGASGLWEVFFPMGDTVSLGVVAVAIGITIAPAIVIECRTRWLVRRLY